MPDAQPRPTYKLVDPAEQERINAERQARAAQIVAAEAAERARVL